MKKSGYGGSRARSAAFGARSIPTYTKPTASSKARKPAQGVSFNAHAVQDNFGGPSVDPESHLKEGHEEGLKSLV
jgi:hypothetical protein